MADAPEKIWLQRPKSDLKPFPTADTALLATSVARGKLQSLKQDGYHVCGLAIQRGDQYGIVTDFGRVVWLSSNAGATGLPPAQTVEPPLKPAGGRSELT